MGVEEYVVDTMYSVASDVIKNAGYDKTIQAQIVSCQDATIGKYRCRYQDAVFYAYANNTDMSFSNGAYVYILIPNNDFKQEKTILGTTQKLGIDYISQTQGEQAYEKIGINCVNSSQNIYYLDSNNQDYKYILYHYADLYDQVNGVYAVDDYVMYNGKLYKCIISITTPQNFNSNYWTEIENENLDIESLEQYIKNSSSIILGAVFKTSISVNNQYQGHYGLRFNLAFMDNASGHIVIRPYQINEDNMTGNPYRLAYPTRQFQIFDIDSQNFLRIDSIEIFNKGFPNSTGNISEGKLSQGDIQITNIQITGAMRLSENQLNGVVITFFTPQGTFFTSSSTSEDKKTITAQVRVKGKLASSAQNIPFYWGKENVNISSSNLLYNKQLGRGWECLNQSNIIQNNENDQPIVQWTPGKNTIQVDFDDATAENNRYKVAIIYNNVVISKQINIKNLGVAAVKVSIISDAGNDFYYDNGHPNLTCTVKAVVDGAETDLTSNCNFYWAYEGSDGSFIELPETTEDNAIYDFNIAAKQEIERQINAGETFKEIKQDDLNRLQAIINSYDFIQRVKGNHIYDAQIKNIVNFGVYKCSVFNATTNVYYGTAAITLTNSYDREGLYSLVINNGAVAFHYNEDGVAPNSKSLDVPQQIQALTFTIYDNLGNVINSDEVITSPNCSVEWGFPIEDSLLINPEENGNPSRTDLQYVYYKNVPSLVYEIAKNYNKNRKVNQIILNVDYKGMNLTTKTQFIFTKQGDPGTNGTEYVVKLIPNTGLDDPPLFPMITTVANGSFHYLNYGIGDNQLEESISIGAGNEYQFFKAQLWKNGERIWQGFSNSPSQNYEIVPEVVHWEILRNQYKNNVIDDSNFEVSNASSGYFYYKGSHLKPSDLIEEDEFNEPRANIIKCTLYVNGKSYYGTIPIITAWVSDDKFRISLKDYTGFRYVVYTSDGINPQYDQSHPFEFICKEQIEDQDHNIFNIDVSNVNGEHTIAYNFSSCGNIWSSIINGTTQTLGYKDQNLITVLTQQTYRRDLNINQINCRATERYDGYCVNAAVLCQYIQGQNLQNDQNGTVIGRINVPIHFLLNKYGLSNLNDWDGNHIQINDQEDYILAPQIGAGKKQQDNSFTGILMGSVKRTDKEDNDVGIMGYSKGDRTLFLNSQNGSAIFGKANAGQIIIDPAIDLTKQITDPQYYGRALLYSSNFWQDYDKNGLPSNYNSSNENDQGLLINLTKPQIRYGNGNFSVNNNGHLIAKGGGQIAGWDINDYDLTAKDGSITLHSSQLTDPSLPFDDDTNPYIPGRIYSDRHETLTNTYDGFFLSNEGLSIGSMFKVTKGGVVTVGRGAVEYNHEIEDLESIFALQNSLACDGTSSGDYIDTELDIYDSYNDITILIEFKDTHVDNTMKWLFEALDYEEEKGACGYVITDTFITKSSSGHDIEFTSSRNQDKPLRYAYTYYHDNGKYYETFRFSIDGEINENAIVDNVQTSAPVTFQTTTLANLTTNLRIGRKELTENVFSYWQGNISRFYVYGDKKNNTFINNFLMGRMPNNQGVSKKHWTISGNPNGSDTYIAYNTNHLEATNQDPPSRVYIGTDGIALGRNFSVSNTGLTTLTINNGSIQLGEDTSTIPSSWKFSVNNDGYLQARSGKISGIQMHKNTIGQVNQLRAGTKVNNVQSNPISNGFVFQSSGRVLGVGSQKGEIDQSAYLSDWFEIFLANDLTWEIKQLMWGLIELEREDPDSKYKIDLINIWEFTNDSGIFRGGRMENSTSQTNPLTHAYRLTENNQNFRIEPANGYARFMATDVIGQLAVAGDIITFKNKSYSTIKNATSADLTFFVEAQTGNTQIKGDLEIGAGMIALYKNGKIATADDINCRGDITCNSIIPTQPIYAVFG